MKTYLKIYLAHSNENKESFELLKRKLWPNHSVLCM